MPEPVAQIWRRLIKISAKFSPGARALTLGMATPLLPCGLVWGMALAAIASGGASEGAELMGAFALGSLPALALAQAQAQLWPSTGRAGDFLRRGVVLLAALVIVWRAVGAAASTGAEPHCH
jgi:sulfite exporter TauE/SafE